MAPGLGEAFDLSIFFGPGRSGNTGTLVLAEDTLFPVCAPEIAKRLTTPGDLSHEILLHDASWRDDWAIWLAAEKHGGITAASGPVYSLYSLAIEEAIHGAGVLIGHAPLVAPALASGALVAPFTRRIATQAPLVATLRAPAPAESLLGDLARSLAGQETAPPA